MASESRQVGEAMHSGYRERTHQLWGAFSPASVRIDHHIVSAQIQFLFESCAPESLSIDSAEVILRISLVIIRRWAQMRSNRSFSA